MAYEPDMHETSPVGSSELEKRTWTRATMKRFYDEGCAYVMPTFSYRNEVYGWREKPVELLAIMERQAFS